MLDMFAGVFGVYFIGAMLSLFVYIIFKKGNWKKSLMHIGLSVLLVALTVAIEIML
ncbi:MAG: hypothetical protein E6X17_07550 [Sporomusaceae bacterium]|nr:hypothetical protein [Sporomusaceae bacterium]